MTTHSVVNIINMGAKKYIPTEAEEMMIRAFIKMKYSEKKIAILVDRTFRNIPLKELAKKYKVSVNYVHLVEAKLLKIIRTAMDIEWESRLKEYNRIKKI